MTTGRHLHQQGKSYSTPTPATGMFQPRPFAQTSNLESTTTPDLQAKVELGQNGDRLSRIEISQPSLIQPKLAIGSPGDKYEQEADTIARKVVKQISAPTPPDANGDGGFVQRQEFSKPSIMRLSLQRQAAIAGGEASSDLESSIAQAKGSGKPMEEPIRRQMEGAFGADFSGVRVHTHNTADTLNRSLSARAFTTGNNIFFKQGEYNPSSSSGQELLAHELTHVVQQGQGSLRRNTLQRKGSNLLLDRKFVTSQRIGSTKTEKLDKEINNYNEIPVTDRNYSNQKRILVEITTLGQAWIKTHSNSKEQDKIQEITNVTLQADRELNTVMAQEQAQQYTQGMPQTNRTLPVSEEVVGGGLAASSGGTTGPTLAEKVQGFLTASKQSAENELKDATQKDYGIEGKIGSLIQVLEKIPLGSIASLLWNLKEAYKAWGAYKGLETASAQETDAIHYRKMAVEHWEYKGYVWKDVSQSKADEEIKKAQTQGNDELKDAYEHGTGKVKRRFWTKIQTVAAKIIDIIAYVLTATGVAALAGAILKLATQVVEIAELVYRKIKGIYKAVTGQRGVHRKQSAEKIVYAALQGDPRALKTLVAIQPLDGVDEALLGKNTRQAGTIVRAALPGRNIFNTEEKMKQFLKAMKENSAEAGMNINQFIAATAEKLKSQ